LQIALDSDDTRLGANVRLGQAYWSLDEFQQAVQHLNEAVLEDPSNVDGRRWLAVVYNDLGADQLALENFSIWAQLAPDDGRPFRGMGMIYEGMQNYPDAIRNYRQSLDLTTDEADRVDIVLDLAECYHKDLKHARAIEHLLELPPTGDVLALRAQCEHGLGNTDVAQAAAEQALAVTPDHLGALVVKGTVATERDDAKTAIETLEHARQLYPSEYTVRFLLAQAYERFGEPQKAEEERGRAERLRVMREDHARLVQEAMVDVSNFEIRYELGQLARQLGMPEAAYFWFLSARALNPGHVPTLQALNEMAQAAAGDIPGNDATVAPSSAPDEKKLPDAGATKPSSQLQIPASGTG
jgi:tetratricopeptide (TPR) repeat protein